MTSLKCHLNTGPGPLAHQMVLYATRCCTLYKYLTYIPPFITAAAIRRCLTFYEINSGDIDKLDVGRIFIFDFDAAVRSLSPAPSFLFNFWPQIVGGSSNSTIGILWILPLLIKLCFFSQWPNFRFALYFICTLSISSNNDSLVLVWTSFLWKCPEQSVKKARPTRHFCCIIATMVEMDHWPWAKRAQTRWCIVFCPIWKGSRWNMLWVQPQLYTSLCFQSKILPFTGNSTVDK